MPTARGSIGSNGSSSRARRIAASASLCRPDCESACPSDAIRRRVAGIETNRATEGRFRSGPVPVQQPVDVPDGELRLREVRIGADRVRGGVARARPHVERAGIAVHGTPGVGERQAGPGQRVVRVERDRPLVLFDRARVGRRRSPAFEVPSPEIRIVGVGVLRLPAPKPARAIGRQPDANLLRDGRAQLLLQPQQAGRLTLVGLRPDMLLIPHANQRRR